MNLIDDICFDDLRLDDRRGQFKHRLVGEKNPSFGNGKNLTGETEIDEIVQEII